MNSAFSIKSLLKALKLCCWIGAAVVITACSSSSGGSDSSRPSSVSSSTSPSSTSSADPTSSAPVSSASSSSVAPVVPTGDPVLGKAIMTSVDCSSCHSDREDGTFGGAFSFNVNNWQHVVPSGTEVTPKDLADYIETTMPQAEPDNCVDECAEDVAAYLWTYKIDNLIPNGGLESGEEEPWAGNDNADVEVVSSPVYEGDNSLFVTSRENTWDAPQVDLRGKGFEAGSSYIFSIQAHLPEGADPTEVKLKIERDAGDGSEYPDLDVKQVSAADEWVGLSGFYTVPSTPAVASLEVLKVYVEVMSDTDFYVDNLTAVLFNADVIEAGLEIPDEGDLSDRWIASGSSDGNWGATDEEARTGTRSVRMIERENDWDSPEINLTGLLVEGHHYQVTLYVKAGEGQQGDLVLTAKYGYSDEDDDHQGLGTVSVTGDGWTRVRGSFTYRPADPDHTISIYLNGPAELTTFYMDDVEVRGKQSEDDN